MTDSLHYFAGAAGGNNMFTSLGIDWKMLILQGVAFLIFVWVMAKWVMPPLVAAVDNRQAKIEASTKAAQEAEKKAESAETRIEATLKTARIEAADIVATAKLEATSMVEAADKRATERADRIVAEAHDELQKDILTARRALEKDTLQLVKKAASFAIAGVANDRLDTAVVEKSVAEAKRYYD